MDDRFGISLGELHNDPFHFSVPKGWQAAAGMGAAYVRFDIPWSSFEYQSQGVYTVVPEKLYWVQQAHANGLKAVVVVPAGGIYSPSWYTNPFDPVAYPKAVAWLVQNYGFQAGDVIEVLNEPNNSFPGTQYGSQTTAGERALVTFTSNTTNAVHAANSAVKVIGLGCQGEVILDMLKMNPIIDGVVVHPYDAGNNHPEEVYEGSYRDYETWLGALQAAAGAIPIWETEFAEDNGSASYVRASWLTRRWLMSCHAGIVHWFPHALVLNALNNQQFLEWTGLDPMLSYYAIRRLFGPNGIFAGVTPALPASVPAITGANTTLGTVKGYVFNGATTTLCGVWYGGKNIDGYANTNITPVTVSFPTTLTNVGGSYIMNMISGDSTPAVATVSNGVATVTNVPMSCEASLIVLSPGSGAPPPPPGETIVQTKTNQYGQAATTSLSLSFDHPEIAGDTVLVYAPHGTTAVGDNNGDTFVNTGTQAPDGRDIWKAVNIHGASWNVGTWANFPSTFAPSLTVTETTP
jgi:hypothetical protein